jgi:hypothetical protein
MTLRSSGVRLKMVQSVHARPNTRTVVYDISVRTFLDRLRASAVRPKVRATNDNIVAFLSVFLCLLGR